MNGRVAKLLRKMADRTFGHRDEADETRIADAAMAHKKAGRHDSPRGYSYKSHRREFRRDYQRLPKKRRAGFLGQVRGVLGVRVRQPGDEEPDRSSVVVKRGQDGLLKVGFGG